MASPSVRWERRHDYKLCPRVSTASGSRIFEGCFLLSLHYMASLVSDHVILLNVAEIGQEVEN